VNKDSTHITLFHLFMEVIQLLLAETNKYSDTLDNDDKHNFLPQLYKKTGVFLAIIIQMWHNHNERLVVHS
jgi:hypothetical protein